MVAPIGRSWVVGYTYDAWGRVLSTTGSLASTLGTYNPLRYRGYVYDHETGLYYLQSRYYNPTMGRFINADGQLDSGDVLGLNLFAYCNNNPVMYSDTTGMAPEWWQWAISSAMFVAGVVLVATGVGGAAGGALICAGVNSIIGSYTAESAGGSSTAGWVGGMISGVFSGFGAGVAGKILCDATNAVGIACLGEITKSIAVSFGFGALGSGAGVTASSLIDGKRVNVKSAFKTAMVGGSLNIGAALFAGMGTAIAEMPLISETSKVVANALSAGEAVVAEAIVDALSVLISLFE